MQNFVTKIELARHLRVSKRTIDNMMTGHQVPYIKVGRIVRFKISEVDAALVSHDRIASINNFTIS